MSPGAMVTMVKKEEEPVVKKEEGGLQKRNRCPVAQVKDINLTAEPD